MSQIVQPPPSTRQRPPRSLPWDVLLLVFQQADPSTLAALGRVNFDFLTSTAPLLYRDVKVKTMKQIEELFCERVEDVTSPSRINHLLDLSQIRTLSLDLASLSSEPTALRVSPSRLSSDPILLNILHLSIYCYHKETVNLLYLSLFPFLNPITFELEGTDRPYHFLPWFRVPPARPLSGWNRIDVIDFKGVVPYTFAQADIPPPPSPTRRRTIRTHLSTLFYQLRPTAEGVVELLGHIMCSSSVHFAEMQEGSLVLVVESDEKREEAEAAVASVENEGWRSKFSVVVEA